MKIEEKTLGVQTGLSPVSPVLIWLDPDVTVWLVWCLVRLNATVSGIPKGSQKGGG